MAMPNSLEHPIEKQVYIDEFVQQSKFRNNLIKRYRLQSGAILYIAGKL